MLVVRVSCLGRTAYLAEREEPPELNQPMEVPETDVHRYEDNVHGVSEEMPPELDSLAEHESPEEQEDIEQLLVIR